MKKSYLIWSAVFASAAMVAQAEDNAADSFVNHLTFSGRFGFNINAKFSPRLTTSGGTYNYLDGYVLPDASGGFDPTGTYPSITHNWGYDFANQNDAGNKEVLLTALANGGDPMGASLQDDPQMGFEISYERELGRHGKWHYGLEAAVSYMNLCLNDNPSFTGNGSQYRYPYTFNGVSGNNPPYPYAGTYEFNSGGPNFEISQNPSPGAPTSVPVSLAGQRKFDADIWGFRLGPYIEYPLGDKGKVTFKGGLAAGLVNASASWSETLTVNGNTSSFSGSGSNVDVLYGWYLGVDLGYQLSKHWSVVGGVQWQDLGRYTQQVGGATAARTAELDMSSSVYLLIGLSFSF